MLTGPLRIFLIEDSLAYRTVLKKQLTGLVTCSFIEAASAPDAIAWIEKVETQGAELPHGVFLDYTLGVDTADRVLTRIKASPVWKAVPVYVISAETSPDILLSMIDQGALDCIEKPATADFLKQALAIFGSSRIP